MKTVFSGTYSGKTCVELVADDGRLVDTLILDTQRLNISSERWNAVKHQRDLIWSGYGLGMEVFHERFV